MSFEDANSPGGIWLTGVGLRSVSFRNADLRNAGFRNATARDLDLRGADLRGTSLAGLKVETPALCAGMRIDNQTLFADDASVATLCVDPDAVVDGP